MHFYDEEPFFLVVHGPSSLLLLNWSGLDFSMLGLVDILDATAHNEAA
jgi:hypothetical protein